VAIRILPEEDCGIIPVTEGNGDVRVVGVITDRDIARSAEKRGQKALGNEVERVIVGVSQERSRRRWLRLRSVPPRDGDSRPPGPGSGR
jgi:CBS domain-containing protein